MKRAPRRKQGTFSLAAVRRREIERHARHVGAANTEDFWRWLVAWSWHNRNSRDNAGALVLAAERMGGELSNVEAVKALEQADDMPRHRSADSLAEFLGIAFRQRQALGIKTIGAIDVNRRARALLRKRKRRSYFERRRRSRGAVPRAEWEANSKSRIKPWEQEGMSRRAWYRKSRGTGPQPITPTPTDGENGTGPQPIILSLNGFAPVPPEGKQGASGGSGVICENGVWLSRRWIAAREKACGCRHNRSLPADPCQAGKSWRSAGRQLGRSHSIGSRPGGLWFS